VVEVVAAMVSASFFPLEKAFSLVLDCDALLEFCVVVSTAVTSVHGDEKGVEFVLRVFAGCVSVGRDTGVIVKERHLSY
jgi:hypothetical protein